MELKVTDLCKSYGKTKALNGFSATFTSGIYALLGPNGSGKSTLMNILTQNLSADSGAVTYNGENIAVLGVRYREILGFMPQYPGLYPAFSVEEYLMYMATLKGIMKKGIREEVQTALEAVELEDVAHHKIRSLSGGMKQRLALAQATLGHPEIIILDEPTAGMDPKQRIAIRNYISKIAFDKIVLLATHIVPDVEFVAKEVIMLKKGTVLDTGSPKDLVDKMAGKTWTLFCREEEVPSFSSRYCITNINGERGTVALSLLSDKKPEGNAVERPASLEDCYLYYFGDENAAKEE